MTKTDTEKEILALRYPIDIDVTDDIFKKRYFWVRFESFNRYVTKITFYIRLDYIPTGFGSSTSDGMKKLEDDVKEASKDYIEAEELEDKEMARLRRFTAISQGVIQQQPEDHDLMQCTERTLKKNVARCSKMRRKLRAQMEKRIKARDTATEQKNEAVEKKEGQIYFDGTVYTARWSSLPA